MSKTNEVSSKARDITVAFKTIGCKLNQYETEAMKTILRQHGCMVVPFDTHADFYIVNTCTVTSRADYKSRLALRKPKRINPDATVIATGCYAQLEPETIGSIEGVDMVLPNDQKANIARHILGDHIPKLSELPPIQSFLDRKRAFIRIENGCDYSCTYCRVRVARGKAVSIPAPRIINEIKGLIDNGYLEIVLTGVNIGLYQDDAVSNLAGLIKEIMKIDGLYRLRISSIEPTEIRDELIDLMANETRFANHLHIPMQSGSDRILKLMGRRYSSSDYEALIMRISEKIPYIGLGGDVMVGFPGETDSDFAKTVKLVEKLPFTYLHIFTYSPRKDTPAFAMNDDVPSQVKKERYEVLRTIRNNKINIFLNSLIGREETIIPERIVNGVVEGLSGNYARARVNCINNDISEPLRIIVIGRDKDILIAKKC